MSKILITSSGFLKNAPKEQIKAALPPSTYKKVAYITTASKVVEDSSYAEKEAEIMRDLGYEVDEIDLAEVPSETLEGRLRGNDFIYVQGGNPYYLLKNVRESGFADIAPKLIKEGIPYVGKSAGAYILAPEVLPPTWYSKEWRKFDVENLDGMGIVDFVWAAHYDPEDEEMKEDIQRGIESSPYPVRVITNDQGFLIEDDKVQFFGEGKEHILDPELKPEGHTGFK